MPMVDEHSNMFINVLKESSELHEKDEELDPHRIG
jgi:hypothetical protein